MVAFMHSVFLIIFLTLSFVLRAQSTRPQLFQNLIPAGYTVLDSASGNLNNDAYKDMVLILKNSSEDLNPDTTRPLLLLAGAAEGYQLLYRNDSVVLCKGCGGVFGDPYAGITIKNGYFSIEHYGGSNWRWTRIITFKYDVKSSQFKLHRDAGVSFHTSDPGKTKNLIYNKPDFGKLLFNGYSYNKGF
jgi:hypothetical protein